VVVVSNVRYSTTCKSVVSVTDNLGDSYTQAGAVSGLSSSECAVSEAWYATASGGSATITVTFAFTIPPDSTVLEVYDLRNALASPTVVTGSCPPNCGTSLTTSSSLSFAAASSQRLGAYVRRREEAA
jgi:hypothetical protein